MRQPLPPIERCPVEADHEEEDATSTTFKTRSATTGPAISRKGTAGGARWRRPGRTQRLRCRDRPGGAGCVARRCEGPCHAGCDRAARGPRSAERLKARLEGLTDDDKSSRRRTSPSGTRLHDLANLVPERRSRPYGPDYGLIGRKNDARAGEVAARRRGARSPRSAASAPFAAEASDPITPNDTVPIFEWALMISLLRFWKAVTSTSSSQFKSNVPPALSAMM